MNRPIALGITGFSLIAVTYGMARFSWGLMLPDIRQSLWYLVSYWKWQAQRSRWQFFLGYPG